MLVYGKSRHFRTSERRTLEGSVLGLRDVDAVVRARVSAPGVEVELCAFPAVAGEEATTREDQAILSLGLSALLPGSAGRYRPEAHRRFVAFGPLHLRPAGVPLQFRYAGGRFRTVRCRFEPEHFSRLSGLGGDWTAAELDACLDLREPRVEEALLRLAAECESIQPDSPALVEALTSVALVDLGRHLRAVRARAEARTGGLPAALVRRIVEHVEAADAAPSVTDLAQLCGLSRGHFARSFRQSLGVTPAKYVEASRIRRAKAQLAETDEPIGGLATRLGFSSAAAFSKVFHRAVGRSPTDYRQRMR
jgi:AraC family transcriptional regulator